MVLFRTATSWSPLGTFPHQHFWCRIREQAAPGRPLRKRGERRPRQLGRRRGRREDHTDPRQEGGAAMAVPALDALYFLDARGNVIMSRTYREDIG